MTTVPQGSSAPATGPVTLLIATRKGAWLLKGDGGRRSWAIDGPVFLGHIVHHPVGDPRDQRTLLWSTRCSRLPPICTGPSMLRVVGRGPSTAT